LGVRGGHRSKQLFHLLDSLLHLPVLLVQTGDFGVVHSLKCSVLLGNSFIRHIVGTRFLLICGCRSGIIRGRILVGVIRVAIVLNGRDGAIGGSL
jgi:hypothetical protein